MYVFMSFASPHTGKNLGCCIVQVDDPNNANDKCKELGLMPMECNHARGYVLDDDTWQEEDMELNRFYTPEEMLASGHEKHKEEIR